MIFRASDPMVLSGYAYKDSNGVLPVVVWNYARS